MTKKLKLLVACGCLFFMPIACGGGLPQSDQCCQTEAQSTTSQATGDRRVGDCPLPPASFQDSGLVGQWRANTMSYESAILLLREDHTYKQTYDNSRTNQHYESRWLKWWIEHRPNGMLDLHLQGMRLCTEEVEDCDRAEGGAGNRSLFDFCEKRGMNMRGEVILLVVDASRWRTVNVERGIELALPLTDQSDNGTTVFTRQN